jgi:hypothetical protein
MNTLLNTLYTPLDCPPRPEYDVTALKSWIDEYYVKLKEIRTFMKQGSGIGNTTETIWTPVNPFHKFFEGWQGRFNERFPELSSYFLSAFDLNESDIKTMLILPINPQYVGTFWRQDPDEFGLRMFLNVEENTSTKLLLKKTKEAYDEQPAISARFFPDGNAPDIQQFLQPEVYECELASTSQCYYVNNVRASHATQVTEAGKSFITIMVFPEKSPAVLNKINSLVERSLEKYSKYAITY